MFSHAVVAVAVGKALATGAMPARFWWLSILCAILPDADVVGFWAGIPYGSMLGHRGLTHSVTFAALLSLIVVRTGFGEIVPGSRRWWLLTMHFFLITASHGVLDAMTDGGLGVAFFSPFENSRYFLPWRPVPVSPIGVAKFFNAYGVQVLISEILWIWIPAGLLVLGARAYRWSRHW
jgi:inner membrane protein